MIGGAGTIGQATVKEIYKYEPNSIDVVDISENNLVDLVCILISYNSNLQFNIFFFK